MQSWFSLGSSTGEDSHRKPPQPTTTSSSSTLLSDWNSYASSKASEDSGGSLVGVFDLESAVRSANDTVTGTFNVVSKGVRDIPGSLQSATSNIPSGKSLMYFGLLLATGVFFIFIAFTMFLPVIVLVPQKFALCFTLGCCLIIGSFFALKGLKNQLEHMLSKERLPFTLGFLSTMVGTIYVSMALHSYILSVLFSVLQVIALAYYAVSYFPGGSTGMKFMLSGVSSSILKCFGR
ncbi:protein transport protein SFT2-like isoform X1 [Rhododendron vialii]|uniref:protein transport protein SFT2-like isoform X1 n=1 Tax=Rhododendron vialii TaxID=182163 RepID=UPI00265F4245|nr:protein transport protein SFT2-like isoform X1 [Rhododendron vialii]